MGAGVLFRHHLALPSLLGVSATLQYEFDSSGPIYLNGTLLATPPGIDYESHAVYTSPLTRPCWSWATTCWRLIASTTTKTIPAT